MTSTRKPKIDLDEIWEFIAQDNPRAADKVTEDILSALATLVASPHMGHRRPRLTSRPLRFWQVRNYLIAYTPEETPLWVIAVMHVRQPPRHGRDFARNYRFFISRRVIWPATRSPSKLLNGAARSRVNPRC